MSYNYDLNPWDDNYDNNAGQASNQQQSSSNYATGYNEGYNNPMAQHFDADTPQQYAASFESSQQQDQQETQQPPPPPPTQRSPLRRFIDQHIPICGSFIDTMSGINLPFIDALVQHVNRDLLVSKMFYFFFYSAFGSLFPLMGVYFKQLGMNPAQVGILTGVRPFIEIFSAPFWHSLAERFQKSKALLLFSLLSWIIFTYSLAHIRPPASACVAFNDTNYVLYTPYSANDLSNYDVDQTEDANAIEEKGSSRGNEIFMNKMPQSGESNRDREGKDQILASEENQNDQRRRRKKRQTSDQEIDQAKKKYAYSVEGTGDDLYSSHVDFNVDLDNDYEDRPIAKPDASFINSHHHQQHDASFFDLEMSDTADGPEYDEFEQSYSKSQRYKRGASMREVDDLLGESEENESEDTSESRSEMSNKATKERAGSNAGEDGEGEGESSENDTENEIEYDNGKREPGSGKTTQQQKQSTVTTEKTLTLMTEGSQQLHQEGKIVNKTKRVFKQRHKTPPTHIVGMSPITVEYAVNYNKDKHSQFVTPMFSTIVYKLDDIKEVFFLLLLLISLGEFFSAPALTLADSATLGYLGDNTDLYGRQRMFGSFSWAVTLLLVGMALDNATSIADHPCGPHQRERSYTVCFIIFSLLMACAFLTATQFRFSYLKGNSGVSQALIASANDANNKVVTTSIDPSATGDIDELYASTQPRSIFNTAPPVNAPPPNAQHGSGKEKLEFLDKWKSAVFAQRTRELPEWVNVFRQFRNSLHLMYLFITWFLGCGVGLVFTFLFWHLQDVGGTPTLFGICSVINHISEILAYFFSFSFIKRFGHTKVLSVGLGCNVIRFLYVAFLTNPYYALPFELVQGITHAACFAACCSYTSHVSKPELRTSTQGVMQGLHHGIGRACGALIGGYMINAIGSRASFCIYGLLSGCVLAGFLYVRKKASELKDEEVKVDDSEALGGYGAPQGVPSAIPGKIAQTVSPQDIDYQW